MNRFVRSLALVAALIAPGYISAVDVPNLINGSAVAAGDTGRLGPFACPYVMNVRVWQTGSWNGDTGKILQYATNVTSEPAAVVPATFATPLDGTEYWQLKATRYVRITWANRSAGLLFAHLECIK